MWKRLVRKIPRKSSRKYKKFADSQKLHDSQCSSNSSCNCNNISASIEVETSSSTRTSSTNMDQESIIYVEFEPLVPFKDVADCDKTTLFISKLSLCCTIFDFTNLTINAFEKDLKKATLLELIEFVSSNNSSHYSEPSILAVCKMCSMNLFRDFPPHNHLNSHAATHTEDDDEDHEPRYDPSWPHLHLVYDFLFKFITSSSLETRVAKKYIDRAFLLRLFELFDSGDPRERESLKLLLHKIYGNFMNHRSFIRKNIIYIFHDYVLDIEKHNGIAELLEIFGSIIAGFALPLKQEFKGFLVRVLIPMHKPKSLGAYIQQLTYCITQYIEKEPKLASRVISGILKFWPKTNSKKEVILLSELEDILEATQMVEFQKVMVPLFRRIRSCIRSYSFQVAERTMLLWNNEKIINLIEENRQVILPIIYPALEQNLQCHWNQVVLNLTYDVRKVFQEMDSSLFNSCQSRFEKEQEKLSLAIRNQREGENMENSINIKPIIKGTVLLLTPLATSILC